MKRNELDSKPVELQKIEFTSNDFKIVALNQLGNNFPKTFHEEIEVKYYYDTGAKVYIGSSVIDVQRGDITVVNPYEIHANINITPNAVRYYTFVIGLDFLSGYPEIDLRRILIEDGKKFVNVIHNDARLQTIILRIIEELSDKKEHHRLIVRGLVAEFFALLIRNYLSGDENNEGDSINLKRAEVIRPALSKIHVDYGSKITTEDLANLCNISKYHFCRVFKHVTGVSPIEYIINYRLGIADIMLSENLKSVSKIAELCGFEDESYFCRCYKKRKGISPQKRRKMRLE